LGHNIFTLATSTVVEAGLGGAGNQAFYVGWGLATAIQTGIVALLARRTFDSTDGWEEPLGRADVLNSGLALVAAAIAVVAGMITDLRGF
jgi:hypothetical protein